MIITRYNKTYCNIFDHYEEVENPDQWLECPDCNRLPVEWVFDNGRYARCDCGIDPYKHPRQVEATPIMDSVQKTGGFSLYNEDELRDNWNEHINKLTII